MKHLNDCKQIIEGDTVGRFKSRIRELKQISVVENIFQCDLNNSPISTTISRGVYSVQYCIIWLAYLVKTNFEILHKN